MPIVAIRDPSGDQKNETTSLAGSLTHVAGRRVDDPQRPQRQRRLAVALPGADVRELGRGRGELERRRPEDRSLVRGRPVARRDDDGRAAVGLAHDVRLVPAVGRCRRRPEHARQAGDGGHRAAVGRHSPEEGATCRRPCGRASGPRPPRSSTSGCPRAAPWRRRCRRPARSAAPGCRPPAVRNVIDATVRRPVQVEGRRCVALVDHGAIGRRRAVGRGRVHPDGRARRRVGDRRHARPVGRPGREPERRAGGRVHDAVAALAVDDRERAVGVHDRDPGRGLRRLAEAPGRDEDRSESPDGQQRDGDPGHQPAAAAARRTRGRIDDRRGLDGVGRRLFDHAGDDTASCPVADALRLRRAPPPPRRPPRSPRPARRRSGSAPRR